LNQFRVVAWFEDLNAGAIQSISFNTFQDVEREPNPDDVFKMDFYCPDFIVSTSNALVLDVESTLFEEMEPEKRRGKLILQGQDASVRCLCCHPAQPIVIFAGDSGHLHMWNYLEHKLLLVSIFGGAHPTSIVFDPAGTYVAVGFASGRLVVLNSKDLKEIISFEESSKSITCVTFSQDSMHLATSDEAHCVLLYRYTHRDENSKKPIEWAYVGKHQSHQKAITGLLFGRSAEGRTRLISVGKDRRLVEYDVDGSSMRGGLGLSSAQKLEQSMVPTCILWDDTDMNKQRLVFSNDAFKFRVFGADDLVCEKTALAPSHGSPLTRFVCSFFPH
jgi:cilia- and flagella-associated protein 251